MQAQTYSQFLATLFPLTNAERRQYLKQAYELGMDGMEITRLAFQSTFELGVVEVR